MRKTGQEIELIRRAQKINEEVFLMVKAGLRKGQSEKDLAWMIREGAHARGAEGLAFEPVIAINEHSSCPHHKVTDRRLKKGDLILIDMGVKYRGYCSDMTRMIFTGELTSEQKRVYGAVREAQEKAILAVKSGVSCVTVDSVARKFLGEEGFGKEFLHSLGHGVGLSIHEKPTLSSTSKESLLNGAVVTVEPGVYIEGRFGVRLEDMLVVERGGSVNLTGATK